MVLWTKREPAFKELIKYHFNDRDSELQAETFRTVLRGFVLPESAPEDGAYTYTFRPQTNTSNPFQFADILQNVLERYFKIKGFVITPIRPSPKAPLEGFKLSVEADSLRKLRPWLSEEFLLLLAHSPHDRALDLLLESSSQKADKKDQSEAEKYKEPLQILLRNSLFQGNQMRKFISDLVIIAGRREVGNEPLIAALKSLYHNQFSTGEDLEDGEEED